MISHYSVIGYFEMSDNISEDLTRNLESLGWDDLVLIKRKLSTYIKGLTTSLVDVERNHFRYINDSIHNEKDMLNSLIQRSKQIRTEIQINNSKLLSISERISQSKNFLGLMEYRLPSEKQDHLLQILQSNQKLLDLKNYKNEREKNEILTLVKDASMKLEAIKATKVVRDQLTSLGSESENITKSLKLLNEEQQNIQIKIVDINNSINRLFDAKRNLSTDRENYLNQYNQIASQLDKVNARLDMMAEMRQRQRQEYGHGLPRDALFEVKESAKKKFKSGSKLSFEELKLLYSEKGP
jgi:uncharacterized coiled-coil DUF342 family protein